MSAVWAWVISGCITCPQNGPLCTIPCLSPSPNCFVKPHSRLPVCFSCQAKFFSRIVANSSRQVVLEWLLLLLCYQPPKLPSPSQGDEGWKQYCSGRWQTGIWSLDHNLPFAGSFCQSCGWGLVNPHSCPQLWHSKKNSTPHNFLNFILGFLSR